MDCFVFMGFEKLYPINPNEAEILGHKAYASIKDVPEEIDLALVLASPGTVLSAVSECAQKGVRGIAIITAGFKEKEDEGILTVDRTWMLDESMKAHRLKQVMIPKGWESLLEGFWAESLCSITRIFDNEKGEYHWSKAGIDHFRFSDSFCNLGFLKSGVAIAIGEIEDMKRDAGFKDDPDLKPVEQAPSVGIFQKKFGLQRKRRRR